MPTEHQSRLDHDLFLMDRDQLAEPMSINLLDNAPNCNIWPLSSAYHTVPDLWPIVATFTTRRYARCVPPDETTV